MGAEDLNSSQKSPILEKKMSIYNSLGIGTIKYNSGSLKSHGWSCGKALKVLIVGPPKTQTQPGTGVKGHRSYDRVSWEGGGLCT